MTLPFDDFPPPQTLPDSQSVPEHFRIACSYMLERIEDPLTLSDIAQGVGVPARTLQWAFQLVEGMGPMQWLRKQRLCAVRETLRVASVGSARVADTALRFGFNHLGEFSQRYRRTFGETARETLARRE